MLPNGGQARTHAAGIVMTYPVSSIGTAASRSDQDFSYTPSHAEASRPGQTLSAGGSKWPLAWRLLLIIGSAAFLILSSITGLMIWQGRQAAIQDVQRQMNQSLNTVDATLQLVFQSAASRGEALLPVLIDTLGGKPVLDASRTYDGEAGPMPMLKVGPRDLNGDISALQRIRNMTGADTAVIVRSGTRWMRAATLLQNEQGTERIGSVIDAYDLLALTLDAGMPYSGLVQRAGQWYAMSIEPLLDESGKVYGGLTARVNVNSEVQSLLQWLETTTVAEFGRMGVVQREAGSAAGDGGWVAVAGMAGKSGQGLTESLGAVDAATFTSLIESAPSGSSLQPFGAEGETYFVAWHQVPNWDWVLFGAGKQADFLEESDQLFYLQGGLMLGGIALLALLLGWVTTRTLAPVKQIVMGMERLGQGDLSLEVAAVPAGSRNEVHILLDNLRRTIESLRSTIQTIRANAGEIAHGSEQIAAGNTDLSARTEQQAASLQETAASMEELSATVQQNTAHARQASTLATEAAKGVAEGEAVVSSVVNSMQHIADESRQVVDIVSVIDNLAFQTNILALNAAVEAARAEEHGKGFAVVAAEVRALAQRSAQAAREIKSLIDASQARVVEGERQAGLAGQAMQQLLASVQNVAGLMTEIAAASEEQASGINQVNEAVSQMDTVTQQNAALVEEAAAATASLSERALSLDRAVSSFKMPEGN